MKIKPFLYSHLANKIVSLMMAGLFSLATLSGCASTVKENPGAVSGGAIGALSGGLLGGILGNQVDKKGEGIIIGAILGGLAGGTIGHYAYDQKKDRTETVKRYSYTPSSGDVLRIEDVSVSDATVRPGERIDLNTTYAVIEPDPNAKVGIIETREIRHNGVLIGKPEVKVVRSGGTYTSTVPLFLPKDAKPGTYVVTTTVDSGLAKDARETSFFVK